MQSRGVLLLGFCVTILFSSLVFGSEETNSHTETSDTSSDSDTHATNGCIGSQESVITIINATNNYLLNKIIVNCLAFSDKYSTISLGIVSHAQESDTQSRSTVQCVNNVLIVASSALPFDGNMTNCYECIDSEELDSCPNNKECPDLCRSCFSPNQTDCLVCDSGRYNGVCVDSCPVFTTPNLENGNECECSGNFGGTNCTECLLTKYNCSSGDYFNETSCICQTVCPTGFVLELVDHNATVPQAVIGTPEEESCFSSEEGHERKRASESHGDEGGSYLSDEDLRCEEHCEEEGWRANINTENVCYACGVQYCLECDTLRQQCEVCRDGTLLNEMDHTCHGFFEEICELAIELEEEVEHEILLLKDFQLHLKIALPIVCTFVVFVFLLFAIIAHFRYPHVGHEKRHRKPNKITEKQKTDFEKVLRPQSTVIFR